MIQISKENPNQTSPIERALRFHADSKYYYLMKIILLFKESAINQIKQN